MSKRVLVVDGTGRGHAICDLFVRTDPEVTVFYGPGCGVIEHDRIRPAPGVSLDNPRTAVEFLQQNPMDLVFVSNIDALSRGFVDVLRCFGYPVIGPTQAAAALESSKATGKRFCVDHGIPTAEYQSFTDPAAAEAYISSRPYACVVKLDGLTPNGDGAVVCDTEADAHQAVRRFAAEHGEAFRVVVEERLTGDEISVFALLDGASYVLLPTARDYKRTLDGDLGGNCDGMGSIAPHPAEDDALRARLRADLLDPLIRGLRAERLDFTGFLYLGAMITDRGLRVIEINARFGDSEAEVVLPGMTSSFTDVCRAVLAQQLSGERITFDGLARCTVALTQGGLDPGDPAAPPGWPFGDFVAGQPVTGLAAAASSPDAQLFYGRLDRGPGGVPVTTGGRALHAVGRGKTLADARTAAYRAAQLIAFPGMRYRHDIGADRILAAVG
ncbi:phosphoribosylamine--glycine ligase [Actinoplanes capillaceus]|uniref:phosphoribosylamine--glycine ligase n=1 Tax=Actinoplanes campanulatus TaxID=113559 RepID=A0ABQ3WUN7_9ACTN|nr:phosphoribosylamine--glycine ligase [Actinoplanes capillaceus]GID50001.1 phosphoribosylamine--glycine ligase [Actinoplanes capillaceus]